MYIMKSGMKDFYKEEPEMKKKGYWIILLMDMFPPPPPPDFFFFLGGGCKFLKTQTIIWWFQVFKIIHEAFRIDQTLF